MSTTTPQHRYLPIYRPSLPLPLNEPPRGWSLVPPTNCTTGLLSLRLPTDPSEPRRLLSLFLLLGPPAVALGAIIDLLYSVTITASGCPPRRWPSVVDSLWHWPSLSVDKPNHLRRTVFDSTGAPFTFFLNRRQLYRPQPTAFHWPSYHRCIRPNYHLSIHRLSFLYRPPHQPPTEPSAIAVPRLEQLPLSKRSPSTSLPNHLPVAGTTIAEPLPLPLPNPTVAVTGEPYRCRYWQTLPLPLPDPTVAVYRFRFTVAVVVAVTEPFTVYRLPRRHPQNCLLLQSLPPLQYSTHCHLPRYWSPATSKAAVVAILGAYHCHWGQGPVY